MDGDDDGGAAAAAAASPTHASATAEVGVPAAAASPAAAAARRFEAAQKRLPPGVLSVYRRLDGPPLEGVRLVGQARRLLHLYALDAVHEAVRAAGSRGRAAAAAAGEAYDEASAALAVLTAAESSAISRDAAANAQLELAGRAEEGEASRELRCGEACGNGAAGPCSAATCSPPSSPSSM